MEIVQPSGSGGGGGGQTLSPEIPVGTINDSNTIFTVAHQPVYIVVNGSSYIVGQGIYATYGGGVITLSSAVGTNGFITSFYNSGSSPTSSIIYATEIPNGTRTVFTFALATAQPSFIVADYAEKPATAANGSVLWTWNAGLLQATMTTPPTEDIYGIV